MADISSLLPPPPPKPSFANRIKIKLEYTDLKSQFYRASHQKESLLLDLAEKDTKKLKLRMDLILDQIELIRSRLPVGYQQLDSEEPEMTRYRKYQEKTEGFMYESDDQLINQQDAYDMNQDEEEEGEEEEEQEEDEEDEAEVENEEEAAEGEEQVEGEEEEEEAGDDDDDDDDDEHDDDDVERAGTRPEAYHYQGMIERTDFAQHPRSLPPAHHQQIPHQQRHQELDEEPEDEEREDEDEDEEEEDEEEEEEDEDGEGEEVHEPEDEYEGDGEDQPMTHPHSKQSLTTLGYMNKNVS